MHFLKHFLLKKGFTFLSLTIFLLLQGCVRHDPVCSGTTNATHNLVATDTVKVPYNGYDTLYFLSKNNDTSIVVGTGKQYYYESELEYASPDCPPTIKHFHQAFKIDFVPLKGHLSFTVALGGNSGDITVDRENYNVFFYKHPNLVGVRAVNNPYYMDSIDLNNKWYYQIGLFVPNVRFAGFTLDTTYKLYYNNPYGILYIKSEKQNEEYSIIQKP